MYEESGVVFLQSDKEEPEAVPGSHADALSITRMAYAGDSITDDAIRKIVGEVPYSTEGG